MHWLIGYDTYNRPANGVAMPSPPARFVKAEVDKSKKCNAESRAQRNMYVST